MQPSYQRVNTPNTYFNVVVLGADFLSLTCVKGRHEKAGTRAGFAGSVCWAELIDNNFAG